MSMLKFYNMYIVFVMKKNKSLEVFDLSWNGLGAHGAAGLAKGLQGNTKLKVLDLT